MGSLLDAFVSPLGTVYDNMKLFEIIANCSQSLPDLYHLKPLNSLRVLLPVQQSGSYILCSHYNPR